MNELRGLDDHILGVHITDDPRSPYYTGPECTCDADDGDDECHCYDVEDPEEYILDDYRERWED